jgi:alpha-amylase/alpha-mannosidase (GH57 family)
MATRAFCIHGHFYQPPREDPLTDVIPYENGARPYFNWNERILAECYRPNAEIGNLEKISFNFGPTLLRWMAGYDPATVRKIILQDQANVRRHGVGNAMAQPYNHTILPLATYRDKVTQVKWGIADFRARFGRQPLGMWLPECAVDTETLVVLADFGIQYTILAPWQAQGSNLDTSEPYWINLPGDKRLAVFFYHGQLSGRVSFDENITINADHFARYELQNSFNPEKFRRQEPQLLLIATDGELYGHHKSHREYFLNHLTNGASSSQDIHNTYPALWLREYPPRRTIRLNQGTSWSCYHGLQRWSNGCACTPGEPLWKYHLRGGINRIAASIDEIYYEFARRLIPEPWALRDHYIEVILRQVRASELISDFSAVTLNSQQLHNLHRLLEAQFERQRMFTSCAWFFEDMDRIEPRNNIAYAAQAVWRIFQATGIDLSGDASDWLAPVRSQLTGTTGDEIFRYYLDRAQDSAEVRTGT